MKFNSTHIHTCYAVRQKPPFTSELRTNPSMGTAQGEQSARICCQNKLNKGGDLTSAASGSDKLF